MGRKRYTAHSYLTIITITSQHYLCKVVRAFKGRSSRVLRQEFPHLCKLPSLWTKSYFYDKSGKVSTAKIMAYIHDPHHDKH